MRGKRRSPSYPDSLLGAPPGEKLCGLGFFFSGIWAWDFSRIFSKTQSYEIKLYLENEIWFWCKFLIFCLTCEGTHVILFYICFTFVLPLKATSFPGPFLRFSPPTGERRKGPGDEAAWTLGFFVKKHGILGYFAAHIGIFKKFYLATLIFLSVCMQVYEFCD